MDTIIELLSVLFSFISTKSPGNTPSSNNFSHNFELRMSTIKAFSPGVNDAGVSCQALKLIVI